jgi:RHS repeat-associated protein
MKTFTRTSPLLPLLRLAQACFLFALLLALGLPARAVAAEEEFYGGLLRKELLAATPVFEVSDDFPANVEQTLSVRGLIWFSIDEDTMLKSATFSHWVQVTIEKYDQSNTLIGTETGVTFGAKFDPAEGVRYEYGKVYEFANVHRFVVTVTAKSASFPGHFRLEGKLFINRKYTFDCASAPVLLTKTASELYDPVTNTLRTGWETMPGAEEYDLEWAFYDTLGATIALAAGAHQDFDFLYRNNATRITTTHTWYNIPLVYPQGRIYWRIRGVRYKNNNREQSRWTSLRPSAENLVVGKEWYWVQGHEKSLNWQMQAVFAEEGKRSQSATYFDGSLRNRQNVARSDASDVAVASETIYDSLGRAAVQVMPVPVSYDSAHSAWLRRIQYVDSLALAPGKTSYSAVDFHFSGANCNVASWNPAAIMDSITSAASRYYSARNPWRNKFMAKFTPAADGYPFSVTEFAPDPTGRLRRQGGVGAAFQLGSGHETKHFYGRPDQDELDRLFGNEAGLATHYQKNSVMDPNGQISVTYLDAHGRTVATALAGAKPANVEQLPNFSAAATVKKDLLNNIADGQALRSTYTLFVGSVGPDTFRYSFSPPLQLSIDSCLAAARCYDCKYDVEISVLDACGQQMINGGAPFVWNNHATLDLSCATLPDTLVQAFISSLPVGEYQVTKTIRISQKALDAYADDFLQHLTCIPDLDSLKRQFRGDTICAPSCEECLERLGNWADFLADWTADIPGPAQQDTADAQNAYAATREACNEICDKSDPSDCDVMYQLLLLDVSPGGQYADYGGDFALPDSTWVFLPSNDTTSVFYKNPGDPLYPYQDVASIGLYLDEFGNVDYVTLPDSVPVRVDSLSINDFISYFKPSWAKTLVKAHPQYCAWLCCKNSTDPAFDSLLTTTTTYAQAVANGFLPVDSLMALDTFFNLFPDLYGTFDTIWKEYTRTYPGECGRPVSLVEILKSIVYCGGQLPCNVEVDTLCTADADMFWELIKSHYLSERSRLKWLKMRAGACAYPPDSTYCRTYAELCFGQPTCGGQPNPYRYKVSRINFLSAPPSPQAAGDSIHVKLQYVREQIERVCDTACMGMADTWIRQLAATCDSVANANPTQLALLRARFIAVCTAGCGLDRPFGSVDTPGDPTAYGDHNLQEALAGVFPLLDTCTMGCRTELLAFPGTYTVPQYAAPPVLATTNDSCLCARLNYLSNCIEPLEEHPALIDYINDASNVTITQAELDMLLAGCGSDCHYLNEAVAIPPMLQCGVCKTLEEVSVVWAELEHAPCLVWPIDKPEEQDYAEGLLNRRLGLNRTFEDYYAFVVDGPQDAPHCRYLCPLALFPSGVIDTSCVSAEWEEGLDALAHLSYQNLLDSMRQVFVRNYLAKCLGPELKEVFTVTLPQGEYHYTLYYYDQADNLVRTVPPKGVAPLTASADLLAVKAHRANPANPSKYPAHNFNTRYWYNALNQVLRDSTPDRGDTDYWYDKLGRLVLSQNGVHGTQRYTYNRYDALGRLIETGLTNHGGIVIPQLGQIWEYVQYEDWLLNDGPSSFTEVTRTYYDDVLPGFGATLAPLFPNADGSTGQTNLRNRVASVTYSDTRNNNDTIFTYATHYSYDIAGNVKQMVQDMPELAPVGHRYKRIGYEYDLVSGKVNRVYYQKDSIDQFIHRYAYDADNRVEFVQTSRDGLLWERDANYEYYLHGPLGRTELGERRVQGLDYAYTLQGWLKGLNASALSLLSPNSSTLTTRDMGRDGNASNTGDLARNRLTGRDVAAFTLGYYYGDYRLIATTTNTAFEMAVGPTTSFNLASPGLYNGNIRHAVYTIARLKHGTAGYPEPEGYAYKYDQLNRLRSQRAYTSGYSLSSNAWVSSSASTLFQEDATYDPNGNILTYYRRGNSGTPAVVMDDLTYNYGSDNNRLLHIDDAQTNTAAYTGDLEDQSTGNYTYDAIGNLTFDALDGILMNIYWTNNQKIKRMNKTFGVAYDFRYNPMQQRVAKVEQYWLHGGWETRTYYVRDAQGNVMATYRGWGQNDGENVTWDSFALAEQHIYGSSRVGYVQPEQMLYPTVPENPHALDSCHYVIFEGWKRYEISNHLGNVLAVVTDRKRGRASSGTAIQWYEADVLSTQQYYPFGMLMPGNASATLRRQYSLNSYDYRYGFNGKEGDDEVKGDDNQVDFGARPYDPRSGRWLSVDPMAGKYPGWSPYNFVLNTPLILIDPDGMEPDDWYKKDGKYYFDPTLNKSNKDTWFAENNIRGEYIGESFMEELGQYTAVNYKSDGAITFSSDKKNMNSLVELEKYAMTHLSEYGFDQERMAVMLEDKILILPAYKNTVNQAYGKGWYNYEFNNGSILNNNCNCDWSEKIISTVHTHPGGSMNPSGMPGFDISPGDYQFWSNRMPNRSHFIMYSSDKLSAWFASSSGRVDPLSLEPLSSKNNNGFHYIYINKTSLYRDIFPNLKYD